MIKIVFTDVSHLIVPEIKKNEMLKHVLKKWWSVLYRCDPDDQFLSIYLRAFLVEAVQAKNCAL